MRSRFLECALAVTLIAVAGAQTGENDKDRPAANPLTTSDEENGTPLILELRLRSKVISGSFRGILTKDNVLCLPFKALLDQLGIFAWLNLPRSRVFGRLGQPEGPMELDMLTGKAAINGKTIAIESASANIIDGDMYVDVRLLEKWLPIKFLFSYPKLEVSMQPSKKLPIEAEWDRAARQANLHTTKSVQVATPPPTRLPYKIFSAPYVDFIPSKRIRRFAVHERQVVSRRDHLGASEDTPATTWPDRFTSSAPRRPSRT
jgi:hypothetical protein